MNAIQEISTLKLHRLEISNFMRVKALNISADGRHIEISGPNACGKSSSVDAIWRALKGTSTKDVPEPIHHGASKAEVSIDLGEYVVTRHWTPNGGRLVVTAADGSNIKRPQELLNGLLGTYSLDPISFLDRREQDQVDDVLSLCAVAPPVKAVAKITGATISPRPDESADTYLMRLSADETGLYYVQRRDANRTVDLKRDALNDAQQVLNAIAVSVEDRPIGEIDTEIDQLIQDGERRRQALQAATQAVGQAKEAESRLGSLQADLKRSTDKITQLQDHLVELERQLKETGEAIRSETETHIQLEKRISKGTEIVAGLQHEAVSAQETADQLPDPSPRIAELRQERKAIEQIQTNVVKHRHQSEQVERLSVEYQSAVAAHKQLDDTLAELRELRRNLLNNVDVGVSGLEIGEGELRLNGVSFRQASMAERIRTACAVAMRQRPRLRLLRIDEGERLDSNSRELVLQLAEENDFQVIMTRVSDGEALRVEIVDAGS